MTKRDATPGFFIRENIHKTADLLSVHASQETRDALNAADEDLDEIANIMVCSCFYLSADV